MLMPWGKHKGKEVAKLPKPYLEWVRKFLLEKSIHGPLEIEVYKALGLTPPKQPALESVDEMLDRITKEVFERFEARKRKGKCDCGCDDSITVI